jgi:hypothetical protein
MPPPEGVTRSVLLRDVLPAGLTHIPGTAALSRSRTNSGSNGTPMLSVTGPPTVRAGLTASLSVRYQDVGAPRQLVLDVPPGATIQLTTPSAPIVGNEVIMDGIHGTGALGIRVLVAPDLPSVQELPATATLTDANGVTVAAKDTMSVR